MITSEGSLEVPLSPEDAIIAMSDMKRMARCLPGAELDGPDEDGGYSGALIVAFGPKRVRFEGRLTHDFDVANLRGTVRGTGSGKMRNSNVAVTADFNVSRKPDDPNASTVDFVLNAQFSGMLADLARTGGRAVLGVLLEEFSRNLKEELSNPTGPAAERKALGAHTVAWRAVRAKFTGGS